MAMTSKQRVYEALDFKPVDRVPRFLWFSSELTRRLCELRSETPEQIGSRYKNDIVQPWLSMNRGMSLIVGEGESFEDEWGVTRTRIGGYNTTTRYPIADVSDMDAYVLPQALKSERFRELDEMLLKDGDSLFVGADVSPILFEAACNLMSMELLLISMADGDAPMLRLLDRLTEFCAEVSRKAVRMGADWIWLGDDLGSQQGMLLSPAMFREYLKPRYKMIIDEIRRERSDIQIAFHSCGSMYPVIGDLVEVGVTVLNPVQESARGMVQLDIKNEFRGKLSLMCGIDTQSFLPFASPDEVRQKTAEICGNLMPGGGFIFGASHTIQTDTGIENIEALSDALDKADFI